MKEQELRSHAVCSICGEKIGRDSAVMFWIIKVERHVVKFGAVRRRDGLAMLFGGSEKLADVFDVGEDMTIPLRAPVEITVCYQCMTASDKAYDLMEALRSAEEDE